MKLDAAVLGATELGLVVVDGLAEPAALERDDAHVCRRDWTK
jgi:hypothetical protein